MPRSASTAARVGASSRPASSSRVAASSLRHCTARAPCPGEGRNSIGSNNWVASSSRPRRARPAAASTTASYSPLATLPRRVSTLPRIGATSMSGRSARSSSARRREPLPTRAPEGSAASRRPPEATSTSRGSPRGRIAASVSPSGAAVGTSFSECTAMSARAVEQRLLDRAHEDAASADLRERRTAVDVALGPDAHELDLEAGVLRAQGVGDELALHERQARSARGEAQPGQGAAGGSAGSSRRKSCRTAST